MQTKNTYQVVFKYINTHMYITNIITVNKGHNLRVGRHERDLRNCTWEVLERKRNEK